MQGYIGWFLLAFALLGLEMLSGTFYMIVFSIAAATAGIAAYFHLGITVQLIVATLVGIVGTRALRAWKVANTRPGPPEDRNLDIGRTVQVESWREDGTLRVQYRGSQWDAELESADTPRDVPLYIKDRLGSVLILTRHKPA
jgi:membrane protein implicated in regulation of membrane protease activity